MEVMKKQLNYFHKLENHYDRDVEGTYNKLVFTAKNKINLISSRIDVIVF